MVQIIQGFNERVLQQAFLLFAAQVRDAQCFVIVLADKGFTMLALLDPISEDERV